MLWIKLCFKWPHQGIVIHSDPRDVRNTNAIPLTHAMQPRKILQFPSIPTMTLVYKTTVPCPPRSVRSIYETQAVYTRATAKVNREFEAKHQILHSPISAFTYSRLRVKTASRVIA